VASLQDALGILITPPGVSASAYASQRRDKIALTPG
jgi:hypothetical protein